MKYILLSILFGISRQVSGQDSVNIIKNSQPKTIDSTDMHNSVDKPAEYPTGIEGLMQFLRNNLQYPQTALDKEIEETIIVKFIVEKDGTVSNITFEKGYDKDLKAEAKRVIKMLPNLTPAQKDGKNVRSYYRLPIRFALQK